MALAHPEERILGTSQAASLVHASHNLARLGTYPNQTKVGKRHVAQEQAFLRVKILSKHVIRQNPEFSQTVGNAFVSQLRLPLCSLSLQSLYQTPCEIAVRAHQFPNLLRFLTARLPKRVSCGNPLHDHSITECCERVSPVYFRAWVPACNIGVPFDTLRSRRKASCF